MDLLRGGGGKPAYKKYYFRILKKEIYKVAMGI